MLIGDGCVAHPGNCYEQSDQVRIWLCCHSAALTTAWSGNQDEKMLGHPPKVQRLWLWPWHGPVPLLVTAPGLERPERMSVTRTNECGH